MGGLSVIIFNGNCGGHLGGVGSPCRLVSGVQGFKFGTGWSFIL